MDYEKIKLGLASWTLGVVVPAAHHVLLHWPLAGQPTDNIVTRQQGLFKSLPWNDHVFILATGLLGLLLVISGLRACGCKAADAQPKP